MFRAQLRFAWLPALCAVTLVAAGCGSSSSSSSSSAATSSAATSSAAASSSSAPAVLTTAPTASQAAAAGEKAAANEGSPVKLPQETVGLVNVVRAAEAAQRLEAGADAAAKALGWKIIAIDAAGDPTKSEAAFVSLVNQHVAGILDLSNPTAAITQGLAEAKAKGIPVINFGGLQDPSPNIQAQYYGDPTALTAALDKYMFAHLPPHPKMVEFTSQILLDERLRDAQFEKDAKAAGATIVVKHAVDLSNLAGDATAAAHAALLAHPDINAFWGDIDGEFPVVAQVLKSANKCGKIGNFNFYDDLINLKEIAAGCGTAVVSSPVGVDGWAAVDQMAEFFARKKSLTSFPPTWNALEKFPYELNFRTGAAIVVTDKSNLPAAGQYVTPKTDYPAFYAAKWKKEYGIG
jgi:ABC-type sugar transport system substrate-binding protein